MELSRDLDQTTMDLRDRVVELRRVDTAELMDNSGNWRAHPQAQRAALRGLLTSVGKADALLAYESDRHGGLTLIDGHLRREDYPGVWPVLVLDVDDEEADLLLATHDPVGALAETASQAMADLLDQVGEQDGELGLLLVQMRAEAELATNIEAMLAEPLEAGGGAASSQGPRDRWHRYIKPVIVLDDLATFEQAVQATGLAERGAALLEICRHYLEANGTER